MEGSASVRRALSGTLVPSAVTTVALREPEPKENGKLKRKVLDEEEYIEVTYPACRSVNDIVWASLMFCFVQTAKFRLFSGLLLIELRENHPKGLLSRCDKITSSKGVPRSRREWRPRENERDFHPIWIKFVQIHSTILCTLWVN